MKEAGAVTYGIELQKEAFEVANGKHVGRILNCYFEQAAFDLSFDMVSLIGVIEHVNNPEELIQMTAGWLRPGGKVMIQTPNTGSCFAKIMGRYWPPYEPIEHIHYFSNKNMTKLLRKHNFGKIKIRSHVKRLTPNYVFAMLGNFGSEFQYFLRPVMFILPSWLKACRFPVYIGEMIIIAEKDE